MTIIQNPVASNSFPRGPRSALAYYSRMPACMSACMSANGRIMPVLKDIFAPFSAKKTEREN